MLYGGVMHLLVHVLMPGTAVENLARLWQMIQDQYKILGTRDRYGKMKLTMFASGGCARLRGTAALIRGIGPALHAVWLELCKSNLKVYRQVELCLRTGCHLEQILDENWEEFALRGRARKLLIGSL